MAGGKLNRDRATPTETRKKRSISGFFSQKRLDPAKIEAAKRSLPLRVMFQDEARFGRITDPRKCWVPAGFRPEVSSRIVREYTYLYGAVCPADGRADFLILPRMDGACMDVFLQELSMRYPNEYIAVFWDGAPCHSPTAITIPDNIRLEELPAYCPDLNPSENIWDDMRESFFGNLAFDSMTAVEEQIIKAALFYENNPKRIKSITGWNWILSAL